MEMKYDVEADWILLETCNFRCFYCGVGNTSNTKIKQYGTPVQWREGFKSTDKTWLLHITGGEPSLYPDFVELCEELTEDHYLSINSNLSSPSIQAFAKRINPERIHFVNAALHYEMRQKNGTFDVFINRVHELQQAKFDVLLTVVMSPHVIKNFPQISERLEEHGLFPIPKVMRGIIQGKDYPTAYTSAEKNFIREYIVSAIHNYQPLINNMGEPPSINVFLDDQFLNGIKDYRGGFCSAGSRFVRIAPNGTVGRCGPPDVLGNIIMHHLRLWNAPKTCNTSYCPYFCEKYSVPDYYHHTLSNSKYRSVYSKYSYLKGNMLNLYYLLQTDGFIEFTKEVGSKVKRMF